MDAHKARARSNGGRGELSVERREVVVIGAGQAGLSAGYYLAGRGADFVILNAARRVGESWRRRWDSLQLFTPASFNSLPGLAFPDNPGQFPTKDEMAEYLETYARRFRPPGAAAHPWG